MFTESFREELKDSLSVQALDVQTKDEDDSIVFFPSSGEVPGLLNAMLIL